jgi:hypothetical protein
VGAFCSAKVSVGRCRQVKWLGWPN